MDIYKRNAVSFIASPFDNPCIIGNRCCNRYTETEKGHTPRLMCFLFLFRSPVTCRNVVHSGCSDNCNGLVLAHNGMFTGRQLFETQNLSQFLLKINNFHNLKALVKKYNHFSIFFGILADLLIHKKILPDFSILKVRKAFFSDLIIFKIINITISSYVILAKLFI